MRMSPSIVPRDDDQDIYLVMDDFGGRLGLAWRETDPDSTNFEIVIRDLLDGQIGGRGTRQRETATHNFSLAQVTYP